MENWIEFVGQAERGSRSYCCLCHRDTSYLTCTGLLVGADRILKIHRGGDVACSRSKSDYSRSLD